uniref:Transmembrane protein 33 n=1 Tax=Panagrellus redivivus TaxID=6233 RepID=A0A7E4W7D8_PANRE
MVEIREETGSGEDTTRPHASNDGSARTQPSQSGTTGTLPVLDFLKLNAIDTFTFVLRLLTIVFAVLYNLPSSDHQYVKSVYFKAFAAAAVTNAIRLYQRMASQPYPIVSQQFLQAAVLEDSAHYLLYSVTFPMSTPVAMALIPIVCYAFYNSVPFLARLNSECGLNNGAIQKLVTVRQEQSENVLSLISCAEIFNFPIFFAMIFTGRGNIFFPVLYFRFLTFRYASRRNPYTRYVFASMKQSLLQVTNSPRCPAIGKTIILKSIELVERFAPPVHYA